MRKKYSKFETFAIIGMACFVSGFIISLMASLFFTGSVQPVFNNLHEFFSF